MASGQDWGFATRAIHAGHGAEPVTGAVTPPVFQTSTYAQSAPGEHTGFDYARTANPTRSALEACLASLEGADYGVAFSAGVAASAAVLHLLQAGDHVIVGDDVYGGTYRLFEKVYAPFGLEFTWVDASDLDAVRAARRPTTKLLWVESPTNPLLKVVDLEGLARVAHEAVPGWPAIRFVVDNTFATPYLQQPLALGADLVVHSTTKYLGGHSDVVGGAVLTSDEAAYKQLKFHQNAAGAIPGPWDAWLTLRGAKTLAVRMRQHELGAKAVAAWLEGQPGVKRVFYPGLPSHPQHELAKRQMKGFGGMVSFELEGGLAAARAFGSALKIFTLAESLGGIESLCCHPVTMTHGSIPKEIREARGVTDGLLRLSVGIEDEADLLADVAQALAAAQKASQVPA